MPVNIETLAPRKPGGQGVALKGDLDQEGAASWASQSMPPSPLAFCTAGLPEGTMKKEQERDLESRSSSLTRTENLDGELVNKSSAPFPPSPRPGWAFWPDEENEDDHDTLGDNLEMDLGSYAMYLAVRHGNHDSRETRITPGEGVPPLRFDPLPEKVGHPPIFAGLIHQKGRAVLQLCGLTLPTQFAGLTRFPHGGDLRSSPKLSHGPTPRNAHAKGCKSKSFPDGE